MINQDSSSKFKTRLLVSAAVLIVVGLAVAYKLESSKKSLVSETSASEIEQIKGTTKLDDQVKFYKQLISRVGAEKAQDELLRSGLPFTGQTHLLNHTVGEYLYKQEGPAGLVKCRDYFLSSCEHGFIILAIGSGGMQEVSKVFDVCRKAGVPVMSQCSHATGHGFLAWQGYRQLIEALQMCDQAVIQIAQFPVFNCYDGVFMENIWGVHEGKASPEQWVKNDDPVYPCNDKRIDYKYLKGCWSNQPARMYQMFNRDIGKIGLECDKIKDEDLKQMCFDGLSRQIHPITEENVAKTFELCGLLPQPWPEYCVNTNARASFSVGNRETPFELCFKTSESGKQPCYQSLFGIIRAYAANESQRAEWCQKVKEESWRSACRL